MPRPKRKLTPQDYRIIEEAAALGATQERIAFILVMAPATFKRRLADDERARLALNAGRARLEGEQVGNLRKLAKGDTRAALALLAWLDPKKWGSKDERKTEARVQVEIVIPPALSAEEYRKVIDLSPKDTPPQRKALADGGGDDAG